MDTKQFKFFTASSNMNKELFVLLNTEILKNQQKEIKNQNIKN